jgi:hypothetical protein
MPAPLIVVAPGALSFWPTATITPSFTCTSPSLMSGVAGSMVIT